MKSNSYLLSFHKPLRGLLVKRYKRFLADIELDDGTTVTAHCTNTGSMASVNVPGQPVIVSTALNLDRKLKFTWEAIGLTVGQKEPSDLNHKLNWVGVNTANPNKLVAAALQSGLIQEIKVPDTLRAEIVIKPGTRLDFVLSHTTKGATQPQLTYIEVKNVTLMEDRKGKAVAFFPDSVSERGTKHLRELAALAEAGHRAVLFYVVQRTDCTHLEPAHHIDPVYGQTLQEVVKKHEVEVLAYCFDADDQGIRISHSLPVKI